MRKWKKLAVALKDNYNILYLILEGIGKSKISLSICEAFKKIHEALGDGVWISSVYVVEFHLSTPVHPFRRIINLQQIKPKKTSLIEMKNKLKHASKLGHGRIELAEDQTVGNRYIV